MLKYNSPQFYPKCFDVFIYFQKVSESFTAKIIQISCDKLPNLAVLYRVLLVMLGLG